MNLRDIYELVQRYDESDWAPETFVVNHNDPSRIARRVRDELSKLNRKRDEDGSGEPA
jgi:hypothetical protein